MQATDVEALERTIHRTNEWLGEIQEEMVRLTARAGGDPIPVAGGPGTDREEDRASTA